MTQFNISPTICQIKTRSRRRWIVCTLLAGTLVLVPVVCQQAIGQVPEGNKPAEIEVPKSFAGEEDFEEACRLRLKVDSLETLKEIIVLAKSAVEKGLDKADLETAKKLIAASYLQKTQEVIRTIAPGMSRSRINKLLNGFVEDLSEAIKFDPLLADAYLMKVEVHARLKEPDAAREAANEGIAALSPYVDAKTDPEAKVKLSRLLMMRASLQSETEEALADLKRSIQNDPNNQACIAILLQNLAQNERTGEALEFFQELLDSNPENEMIIQTTAELIASDHDRFHDAIELLTGKIKVLPDSVALLKTRARVHALNSQAALAKADLDRVLELSKNDVDGLVLRAKVAIEANDLDAARKDVDTAIELAPDRPTSILLRATIARGQKRYADAIADLRLIVKMQPKDDPNPSLLLELGLLYSLDDRPVEAIKVFGQVIKFDPENWLAYSLRGGRFFTLSKKS